ncbi:hsp70-Hsp90 organizing protein 1 isoform X3 [Oryza sativa Japonica Group]|jgi:tetratricopeptide (TPR) repeat protein|uniref:hsp70-Hsp90 organizing protein 1 isoform X3 n=1 Tax=Oryza sativa subsp. japonica TaxID=39947 RepID=UPI0001C7C22D|nr:hsp70-Hsp90 organizing protein 1 isoform X2 [Oryza sativa Japonica Group]XP_015642922.1 hsp70-Hsp90 organizing protein 1 isoform X2 [Oryza sativa Japonica Group]XP_015642923.1 hsp70-Hsp90 organizing protein 1 isoform X2 [Oryza sativa Japonica Group]
MSPVRFNPWRAAEAEVQGVKRKGDSCYNKGSYGKAIKHYTRGAELDPSDISFLIKRAKALSGLGQYQECVRDCNDALRRGEELGSGSSGNKLISEALLWKASALEHLADCAADYEQVILLLRRSLETCHSEEAQIRLKGALFMREQYEELKSQKLECGAYPTYTQHLYPARLEERINMDKTRLNTLLKHATKELQKNEDKLSEERSRRKEYEDMVMAIQASIEQLTMNHDAELKSVREDKANLECQLLQCTEKLERLQSILNREPPFTCPIFLGIFTHSCHPNNHKK